MWPEVRMYRKNILTTLSFTLLSTLISCADSETSFHIDPPEATQINGEIAITFDVTQVLFEDLTLKSIASTTLTATSTGDIDATIHKGAILLNPGNTFYAQEEAMEGIVLVPGDSVPLTITASMSEPGIAEGMIRFTTNATDQALIDIDLLAWTEGKLSTSTTTDTGQ
jgi:hypothetical protein